MKAVEHVAKAMRVERSMHKLKPAEDYLAIVDASLVAGYHWGSALLHAHGVLADADHANTPSKLSIPVGQLPPAVQPAFAAFVELERLRAEYVRSPSRYLGGLEDRVWRALEVMRRATEA